MNSTTFHQSALSDSELQNLVNRTMDQYIADLKLCIGQGSTGSVDQQQVDAAAKELFNLGQNILKESQHFKPSSSPLEKVEAKVAIVPPPSMVKEEPIDADNTAIPVEDLNASSNGQIITVSPPWLKDQTLSVQSPVESKDVVDEETTLVQPNEETSSPPFREGKRVSRPSLVFDPSPPTPRVRSSYTQSSGRSSTDSPVTCPDCNKQFARKGDYTKHVRIHTGEKPYHCKWFCKESNRACRFEAGDISNVLRHIRVIHFQLPPTKKDQKAKGIVDHRDPRDYLDNTNKRRRITNTFTIV